jgi:hypothetical protein
MAKTFDELLANRPVFQPAEVDIEGLGEKLFLHRFSAETFNQLMQSPNVEGMDEAKAEQVMADFQFDKVLKFLRGADYKPTKSARKDLLNVFTAAQLRDINNKGFKLNGFGESSLKDALKN